MREVGRRGIHCLVCWVSMDECRESTYTLSGPSEMRQGVLDDVLIVFSTSRARLSISDT